MIKDDRVWRDLKKKLLSSANAEIKVGFFEEDRYPDSEGGLAVATVANVQEQGSSAIPPRPFMREGTVQEVRRNKNNIHKLMKVALNMAVTKNTTFKKEYQVVGNAIALIMKDAIEKWEFPPNAIATIKRKGFNNPLVDSERMKRSVKAKVG